MVYQFDLLEDRETNLKRLKEADEHIQTLLPVDALQQKFDINCPPLTAREFEIMDMVLKGYSIQEISLQIFLSIAGIKWRLSNVYEKFGVKNRLELIKKSARDGLHFISETGIKHTFHNRVALRGHEDKK